MGGIHLQLGKSISDCSENDKRMIVWVIAFFIELQNICCFVGQNVITFFPNRIESQLIRITN